MTRKLSASATLCQNWMLRVSVFKLHIYECNRFYLACSMLVVLESVGGNISCQMLGVLH